MKQEFTLQAITSQDTQWIYKGLSNPKIGLYYTVHFNIVEETQVQMQWYADLESQGTGRTMVVYYTPAQFLWDNWMQ